MHHPFAHASHTGQKLTATTTSSFLPPATTTARTPPPRPLALPLLLLVLIALLLQPTAATFAPRSTNKPTTTTTMPSSLRTAAAAASAAAASAAGGAGGKEGPLRAFTIVVAATAGTLGIGKEGKLPWSLPEDMAHFKRVTTATKGGGNAVNAVIMGRKTWQSIPERFRPLRDRLNVVLSRNPAAREQLNIPASVRVCGNLQEALRALAQGEEAARVEKVFVIGGAAVYTEALQAFPQLCEAIEFTSVDSSQFDAECDAHFPPIPDDGSYKLVATSETLTENGVPFRFQRFERVAASTDAGVAAPEAAVMEEGEGNAEEDQYLALVREILEHGNRRGDRTQTGTLSKFGAQLRFSLRGETFPLLTTKRVFWRGVAEELLWFISGKTDANLLKAKKIGIWDGNSSREYLDSLGLTHREEGDLGPVYGFQWRHFGAEYVDMHADYAGKGIDQLARAVETIKTNPEDRRIIVSAWNPADLSKMALPPCHMFCQFYVANGELSCQMYQRSADMGLGVPFNIASYALLTRIVAQVCGLKPGEFVHTIGDAHVYLNHVDALKEQLKRRPRPFPKLRINPAKTDIDSFVFDDFTIEGYDPHETIKMKMAV